MEQFCIRFEFYKLKFKDLWCPKFKFSKNFEKSFSSEPGEDIH